MQSKRNLHILCFTVVFCRFRFLLLNPADRLRDIANEARSLVLVGGTMRPVDQLLDAFERVCNLPLERICEFS